MQSLALTLFPLMMAFAASSDFLAMKLPNRISVVLVIAYLVIAVSAGVPWGSIGLHVLAGAFVLSITFLAFWAGQIGGGDAKLAAAIALWVGWEELLDFGVATSFAGLFLTIAVVVVAWLDFYETSAPFVRLVRQKVNCVPYGIALAIGGLVIYPHTEIWRGLAAL